MNPSEAWTLLTVRSKNLAGGAAGHGAPDSSLIAALLAGLDSDAFLMGMAAECGDMKALRQLEWGLWTRARTFSENEEWNPPQGEFTVRRMVGVALYEAIDDRRCPKCNGQKTITFTIDDDPALLFATTYEHISPTTGQVQCWVCAGSGQLRFSSKMKARLAGIDREVWSRWQRRYERIYAIPHNWREEAKQYLQARIREIEDAEAEEAAADEPSRVVMLEAVRRLKRSGRACSVDNRRAKNRARKSAPSVNAPPELEYGALRRPTLTLNR